MVVRPARDMDIWQLMDVYRQAREIMLSCGNVNQWKPGHPSEEMISNDIARGYCRVIESEGSIVGAFAFIPGKDPTYEVIEGGRWIEDTLPYTTIHRLASIKASRGVAKAGFKYCGIIHLLNGEPRLAFQKTSSYKEAAAGSSR